MHSLIFHRAIVAALLLPIPLLAQTRAPVSEQDYYAEFPVVLSAARLPQRQQDVPAAMTVIDRDMIRMSGARDVADLLRLVPGFRASQSFEAYSPQGGYHTNMTDFSNHIQVMVDGRSVYSPLVLGSTGSGLQTVALDDIERIEVLRGSNSASYGARAFLGTINIVTRDTADTLGAFASVARGDNNIQDTLVRLGWGDERARFRLSADRRSDRGLEGSSGPVQVDRFNLRADLHPSVSDTLEFRLGQSNNEAGVGFASEVGNLPRYRLITTSYAQLDWRRQISANQELQLQASSTQEALRDNFLHGTYGILVDTGARASSDTLMLQHTVVASPALRLVWGGELRNERLVSQAAFGSSADFVNVFRRLFTNAEWRLHEQLLLNLGGLWESNSIDTDRFAPRAMLNWQVAKGHTLRYGVTSAYRPPSLFEKYSNVWYSVPGVGLVATHLSTGNVSAERINSREIGYLGEFSHKAVSVDVRLFEEEVRDFIRTEQSALMPPGQPINAVDFTNQSNFSIRGAEYQLSWKPWTRGRLIFSQAYVDTGWNNQGALPTLPNVTTSLMAMQRLPHQFELSLMYNQLERANYPGLNQIAPAMSRTDLRLAKRMRWGDHRAELSLVLQNLGPAYQDYVADFYFRRQAYLMLRVEPK